MPINDPNTDIDFIVDRLVPNADYRKAGIGQQGYTRLVATWRDARPFPTEPEVNAEQVIFLAENPRDTALASRRDGDIFFNFIIDLTFDLENRLRAASIPPQPSITKAQYKTLIEGVFRQTGGTLD